MVINNSLGIELIDVIASDASYRYKEIMTDNTLSLYFSLPSFVEIPLGAYVDFKAERYFLLKPENFKKNHSQNWEYTLVLDSFQSLTKTVKFKFFTMADGVVNSDFKLKFSLTVTPAEFAQLLVNNMNVSDAEGGWTVGECVESEPVCIDFNHDLCYGVLSKISDAFKTEWEFENKTLHIRKIEKLKDSPLPLKYGYDFGILPGISRSNANNANVINRLFIEGSDRNIDRSVYGTSTLLLPKNRTITYMGVDYKTDASGTYIERATPVGRVVEGSLDLTKIYPKRIGTVSGVSVVNADTHLYDVIDTSIPELLDYSTMLTDEKMTIIFQSGQLAGKEFECKYIHADKRFELVPITEGDMIYPAAGLVPASGDKYGIFHIALPTSYITQAEEDALLEAVKYLWENEQAKYTYVGLLDELYAKRNWLAIGGYLNCGYFVALGDDQFLPDDPAVIRITAVKEFINKPMQPEITLSNEVSGKSLSSVLAEIPAQEQATDRKNNAAMQYSRRQYADLKQTSEMLNAALLNFSGSIDPVTVRTMQLIAGDESLQFRFVDDAETPAPVAHNVTYDPELKKLSAPAGIMQHMTLGITSLASSHSPTEYKFWTMPDYISPVLDVPATSYYLYAKVSTTAATGVFILSPTAITMGTSTDADYYLLVGILNSEYDADRSYVKMYGFSELLPGRLTTDMIMSADGDTYFDLINNIIRGKIDFADGLISGLIAIRNEAGTVMGGLNGLADAVYRLWLGATIPEDANFSVDRTGAIKAFAGKIGGLNIFNNSLSSATMEFAESPIELLSELVTPIPVSISRNADWAIERVDTKITQNIVIDRVSQLSFKISKFPTGSYSVDTIIEILKDGTVCNSFVWKETSGTLYKTYSIELSAGTYAIRVIGKNQRGVIMTLSGIAYPDTITALAYTAKTKTGNNGMFSFWDVAKYFYYSQITGLEYKGPMNIPGVLATGSVSGVGNHSNKWGKTSETAINHTAPSVYWVTHSVGHSEYTVVVTSGTTKMIPIVENKSATSFSVTFQQIDNDTATETNFDYVIFGHN